MKFFIVDNGSLYLKHITQRLDVFGHEYEIKKYSPYQTLDAKDADMIILSGGMKNEVADDLENGDPWYHHEFNLIKNTDKPILGICLGLQMVAVALGGDLRKLDKMIEQNKRIQCATDGIEVLGHDTLLVHERHQWVVDNFESTGLKALAYSDDGIEMLYHPAKRIIATQFHPEIDTNDHSEKLFWDLVDLVAHKARVYA